MSQTYLFFDTETNGLPANYQASITNSDNWPRIIQFAWILTGEDSKEIERRNVLVRLPDCIRLDDGAAAIHGITSERLKSGLDADIVMLDFIEILGSVDNLVAHNLDFDRCIIQAELNRQGKQSAITAIDLKTQICTMKRATNYCAIPGGRRGYKWPNLAQLHQKLFGAGFDGAHDAMNDVEAMMRCLWELKARGVIK